MINIEELLQKTSNSINGKAFNLSDCKVIPDLKQGNLRIFFNDSGYILNLSGIVSSLLELEDLQKKVEKLEEELEKIKNNEIR